MKIKALSIVGPILVLLGILTSLVAWAASEIRETHELLYDRIDNVAEKAQEDGERLYVPKGDFATVKTSLDHYARSLYEIKTSVKDIAKEIKELRTDQGEMQGDLKTLKVLMHRRSL